MVLVKQELPLVSFFILLGTKTRLDVGGVVPDTGNDFIFFISCACKSGERLDILIVSC